MHDPEAGSCKDRYDLHSNAKRHDGAQESALTCAKKRKRTCPLDKRYDICAAMARSVVRHRVHRVYMSFAATIPQQGAQLAASNRQVLITQL